MDKWTDRVKLELTELTAKLVALRLFIASPEFLRMGPATQNQLTAQSHVMATYADLLAARLSDTHTGGST